jgi:hypothetical protein
VAASCSPGEDEALVPTATVGPEPTTTTFLEAPPDPSVIPDDPADIDEDYVQAVVDALFAVDAKATEIFVNTRQLDEEGIKYLEAIYIGDELDRQVYSWSQTIDSEALLPGTLEHKVSHLLQVFEDCVFFSVERDYSKTSREFVPPRIVYLGISPKPPGHQLNTTAWVLFTDGFNPDGSQPEDACIPA